MTIVLIILLSVSVCMIVFGHFILSFIDKHYVYPKRLAELQGPIPNVEQRTTPPEDLPPAILFLLRKVSSIRNSKSVRRSVRFTVTFLDLVHRGKIGIVRDGKRLYLIPQTDVDENLLPYERTLLNFVREAYASVDQLSVAKLKGYIEVHREEAANMRKQFMKELMDDFHSRGYYDELKCRPTPHPLAMIGGIAVLGSVGALLGWSCHNIPLGVISVCFAGFAAWLATQIFVYDLTFLTSKGVSAMGEWEAYAKYIRTLKGTPSEVPPIESWNRVALYAAAMEENLTFGELRKLWKNLPEYSLECELYDPYFYKKLSEIDYAILISNVESMDTDLFKWQT